MLDKVVVGILVFLLVGVCVCFRFYTFRIDSNKKKKQPEREGEVRTNCKIMKRSAVCVSVCRDLWLIERNRTKRRHREHHHISAVVVVVGPVRVSLFVSHPFRCNNQH